MLREDTNPSEKVVEEEEVGEHVTEALLQLFEERPRKRGL